MLAKYRFLLPVIFALAWLSQPAFACSSKNVSVGGLKTGVSDVDEIVYISGYVENRCTGTISVRVTIDASTGSSSFAHSFDVVGIPAGGKSFEISGEVPYDRNVQSYSVSNVVVTNSSPDVDSATNAMGEPMSSGATNQDRPAPYLTMGHYYRR